MEPTRRRWVEALAEALGDDAAVALAAELTAEPPSGFGSFEEAQEESARPHPEAPPPTEALLLDTLQVMREGSPLGRRLLADVRRELDSMRAAERLRRIR